MELAEGAYLNIDIEGRVLGAVFLSLEEFASRQRKGGVELPGRLSDPDSFWLDPT
ncbi:MAG: hypothetical protein M3309_08065 [Actinomycetota bacterium]|nr:hypothetical protein [Actinomycetota bacterium]